MNNFPVYLPIRIRNAEKDQDRIFPEIRNIDLQNIQKIVKKPVIVFDLDQKILLQVSPEEVFKVGIDSDWEIISTLIHDLDLSIPGAMQNGDMVITALGKAQRQINQAFDNISNLFSTKLTTDLAEGTNQYFTQARARAAAIQNAINPLDTQRGASQRAVYLALEALRVSLEQLVQDETSARLIGIQSVSDQLISLSNALSSEVQNRIDSDQILNESIQEESQLRISAIDSLLDNISNIFSQLNSEVTNRENGDSLLQNQLDNLTSPIEIIVEDNNYFTFSTQDSWIEIPGMNSPISIPGRYIIHYKYYGRETSNNRINTHRILLDGIPQIPTERSQFLRDNSFIFLEYKIIIVILNPAIVSIQFSRSNGGGSLQAYEKSLHVRRIGDA